MNLKSLAGISPGDLGFRFNLVDIIPSLVFFLVILALIWSGAPAGEPCFQKVLIQIKALEVKESIFLTVALIIFSLVLQPLQLYLIRFLEGYWGHRRPAVWLTKMRIAKHNQRRQKLEEGQTCEDKAALTPFAREQMGRAAEKLRQLYPAEHRLLPTTLGNIMRAAEDLPGTRYGLDAIVLWPRLYPLLPKELTSILADQRNQLDLAGRFCLGFLLLAPISAVFIWRYIWWWLIPGLSLFLGWISYRAAIAAALAYGEGINTAFDLYRFKLLKSLHLPLPTDRDSEKKANQKLSDFLRQGISANFKYEFRK